MERLFCILVLVTGVLQSSNLIANTTYTGSDIYPACHAHAMIGFDSVINSRLGVPAEIALDVTRIHRALSPGEEAYMLDLLTTMMTAYLWKDTPQEFYVQVFNQCMDINP